MENSKDKEIYESHKEISELKQEIARLRKSNWENIEWANSLKDELDKLSIEQKDTILIPISEHDRLKRTVNKLDNELEGLKLENETWEEVSRDQGFKLEVVRNFLANQTSLHFAQMLVRIIDMEIDTEIMS